MAAAVHESLKLYTSSDSLAIEPVYLDSFSPREAVVIQRDTSAISLQSYSPSFDAQGETIHGLIGLIRLNSGDHLIVVTNRTKLGRLDGNDIYKLTGHKIVSVTKSTVHLSEQQIRDDGVYIGLLNDLLGSGYFYFSYTLDLTRSLQQTRFPKSSEPLWRTADDRFFWNEYLSAPLTQLATKDSNEISRFVLPIICGFVEIQAVSLNARPFTYALISRRSKYRAGTRYNSRGVDIEGNVSNYVETEQLVITATNQRVSFVQTRGSIPLFWRQVVNVKYKPKLVIESSGLITGEAFRKHFVDQIKRYGNQIAVNLIDKKGGELKLANDFEYHVRNLSDPRIRYVHFDFHHECRKMRWDRISILVDSIKDELDQQGYCRVDGDQLLQVQSSVIRTNCMDCLDRTNVVQSVFARRVLTQQLRDLGILGPRESVEDTGDFEKMFKNVWADNADAISNQYSGSGALKTDFTRTGKRGFGGLLQDGANSLIRYVKNNYFDGTRQDSFDLLLGKYQVSAGVSPFKSQLKLHHVALPLGALFSIFMAFVVLSVRFERLSGQLFYLLFWSLSAAACLRLIVMKGTEFVERPHLVETDPFHTTGVKQEADSAYSWGKEKLHQI
ncbi:Sac phosphatase domain-containing protein [Polychytrium aggregatum]|uniref:Sac phosphatase domain-containing protein n=1 Tax=Polychytrium aggregatum TaxID=110093 RepID=UPI0022FEE115|nr:Sac phosphatase domain-containing protein [Polychytrium aggregatum]KAI9193572.1 SacI homology domain-containing protein [Polychytrium aggregatum]